MGSEIRDVFLSFAGEDRATIVESLKIAFDNAGISYWLDSQDIKWGDSVSRKINEGLKKSRYGILVLSKAFLGKHWPVEELYAILNFEISAGNVKALPLLVGSKIDRTEILREYPLLSGKHYKVWNDEPALIVEALLERLDQASDKRVSSSIVGGYALADAATIPMYKAKRDFTDRDKRKYITATFERVREYFKIGLGELSKSDSRIDTEFIPINEIKFSAVFYVDGKLLNQCVVWLGGLFGTHQVSYREGPGLDLNNDHSMNDWVQIETDEHEVFLRPGMGVQIDRRLNSSEAGEYFWKRFIDKR